MMTAIRTTREVELSDSSYGFTFDGETLTVGISSVSKGDEYLISDADRLALVWMLLRPGDASNLNRLEAQLENES